MSVVLSRPMVDPELIYLGRGRLHRARANLIQTLKTVSAFERLGHRVRLYLPPWSEVTLEEKLNGMNIQEKLDVRSSALMHPRWGYWQFVLWHRRLLTQQPCYTRDPEISRVLGRSGVCHHLEVHNVEKVAANRRLKRLVQQHRRGVVSWLIAISRSAATALIDAGACAERIHIAPSGVDVGLFDSIAAVETERLDQPRLIYIGRMSTQHGRKVIEAIAEQPDLAVTVVGVDDTEPNRHIRSVGPVPHSEAPEWYGQSDIAIMPYQPGLSHAKSISPMKLFEAMAAGRPILISDFPPIREIITHGHNGLLLPPDDPDAWIRAIGQLRDDRALASRLAMNARADAEQYSWTNRAHNIAQKIGLE